MRKFWLVLVALLLMAGTAYAEMQCFAKTTSNSTATVVLENRWNRYGFTIVNPDTTYSVYVSTYPATSTSALRILPGTAYWQDVNCHSGPIYVMTEPTQTGIVVYVEERW